MSEISDLYQEIVLDHGRNPRNSRVMEDATLRSEGYNPLCGDRVTLYLKLEDGRIVDASIQGSGCAISTASASLMTQAVRGKSEGEARELAARFREMVMSDPTAPAHDAGLGKLAALAGVREFPARVKCATLIWHTLLQALDRRGETTEKES
jgi:nitrogen fixation NifU-like protein